MDKEPFSRTKEAIAKLKEVLKCQLCSELKNHNSVMYYKTCGHFFCTECNGKQPSCLLCPSAKKEFPLSLAKDDSKMAAMYNNVLKLKMPSREEIDEIIKSHKESADVPADLFQEVDRVLKSRKRKTPEEPGTSTKKEAVTGRRNPARSPSKCETFENVDTIFKALTKKKTVNKGEETSAEKEAESQKRRPIESSLNSDKKNVKPQHKVKCETPLKASTIINKNARGSVSSSRKKLNVTKTNCKGETRLHIAGKKGNLGEMRDLLDAGADVNAKDAAGWTPLHDAVVKGQLDVVTFLLENGANVNIPGLENSTALHEAVTSRNLDVAKVLMIYGADNKSKNITGRTPLDIAREFKFEDVVDVLLNTSARVTSDSNRETKPEEYNLEENSVIWKCQLEKHQEEAVQKFAQEYKCEVVSKYSYIWKGNLTHTIIPNDERISLNFTVLSSVFSGSIVTKYQWVQDSLEQKKVLPVDKYIPKDEFYSGFKKCRRSKSIGDPGLFSGCHFYFGGTFVHYTVKDVKIPKDDLKALVEKNGGIVLKRCPDPERVTTELTVPYHANENSSIAKTCYYIIFQSEKWDPKPAYNMVHLKTLPIEWLTVSILNFQLVDPSETLVHMKKLFPC